MPRIFVYEHFSGSPLANAAADAELLAAGAAMRDAVVADLLQLPEIETTCAVNPRSATLPRHPAGREATAVAPDPGESAASFVRARALQHDLAWVIAPETDGLLAELHDAVGPSKWVGCSRVAIRVAASKRRTNELLAARGIATPLDVAPAERVGWIVKPDDGAGALDTRLHRDHASALADLQQRVQAGRDATLEPFVEGEALSISLLAGPQGAQPIALNRQRLEPDAAGFMHDLGVESDAIDPRQDPRAARLQALAHEVAVALPGLRGFVGIDLVWHPRRGPVVIEVNPRVTCAYVGLSARLGRNLAAEVLALHASWSTRDAVAA